MFRMLPVIPPILPASNKVDYLLDLAEILVIHLMEESGSKVLKLEKSDKLACLFCYMTDCIQDDHVKRVFRQHPSRMMFEDVWKPCNRDTP